MQYTSVLGVITFSAILSSNSNTLSIISFSLSSIAPCSSPVSTRDLISSFVTLSSESSLSNPNSFTKTFVDTDSILTKGAAILETKRIGFTTNIESLSAFFIANLLGKSSPNTSVK